MLFQNFEIVVFNEILAIALLIHVRLHRFDLVHLRSFFTGNSAFDALELGVEFEEFVNLLVEVVDQ